MSIGVRLRTQIVDSSGRPTEQVRTGGALRSHAANLGIISFIAEMSTKTIGTSVTNDSNSTEWTVSLILPASPGAKTEDHRDTELVAVESKRLIAFRTVCTLRLLGASLDSPVTGGHYESMPLDVFGTTCEQRGSLMHKLIGAFPVILAALYYALSPFFAELTRKGYIEYLDKVDAEWHGDGVALPPHRTSKALAANIDWIIDAPQMVPSLLLPLATAIFALSDNNVSAVILATATIVICVATLWIYSQSPPRYRSFRIIGHRYTVVSAIGIVLNLAAAAMLLSLSHPAQTPRMLLI